MRLSIQNSCDWPFDSNFTVKKDRYKNQQDQTDDCKHVGKIHQHPTPAEVFHEELFVNQQQNTTEVTG